MKGIQLRINVPIARQNLSPVDQSADPGNTVASFNKLAAGGHFRPHRSGVKLHASEQFWRHLR